MQAAGKTGRLSSLTVDRPGCLAALVCLSHSLFHFFISMFLPNDLNRSCWESISFFICSGMSSCSSNIFWQRGSISILLMSFC